mgnify:CR=1 FL=1
MYRNKIEMENYMGKIEIRNLLVSECYTNCYYVKIKKQAKDL